MSSSLTDFERSVLDAFLAGDDPQLQVLRAQATVCHVEERRVTAVGAFIDLAVPAAVARVSPPAITMGDVDVRAEGLADGAAAMLWVRHGALVLLEFVANAGEWPAEPAKARIGYLRYQPTPAGGYTLVPTGVRDPATLALQLAGHKSSTVRPGVAAPPAR